MSDDELLGIVRRRGEPDSRRQQALDQLAANRAVDHLQKLVEDESAYSIWREAALHALGKLSLGSKERVRVANEYYVTYFASAATKAATALWFVVIHDGYEAWRYQALQYLIKGGHTDCLRHIAENEDLYTKWRDEARQAIS